MILLLDGKGVLLLFVKRFGLGSGQVNDLIENIFQKEERYKANDGGDDRRGEPAERNARQQTPAHVVAAFGKAYSHNGADNRLRTGNRNQRQSGQTAGKQKLFQPL